MQTRWGKEYLSCDKLTLGTSAVRTRVLIGIIVLLALLEAGLVYFGHRLVEDSIYSHYLETERNTSYMSVLTFETILNTTVRQMKMLSDDPDIVLMTSAGRSELANVPSMIGEALSVLLTNALNYTPQGGRVEVVTQGRHGDDGSWSGISVIDTGPGIPPLEMPHLFERFFRGSAAYKSGAPGTGLGLSIACEIVEQHQGKIEIKSEGIPGKGAEFTIWLPTNGNHTE